MVSHAQSCRDSHDRIKRPFEYESVGGLPHRVIHLGISFFTPSPLPLNNPGSSFHPIKLTFFRFLLYFYLATNPPQADLGEAGGRKP